MELAMGKSIFSLLVFLLILQACSSPTSNEPDTPEGRYAKITKEIDEYCDSLIKVFPEMSGMILGVWDKEGNFEYTKAYGYLSKERKTPANTATLVKLASITKMVSTTIALEQVSNGKLSLDDKVTKYFPEYTKYADISVRMLIDMTSGIIDYMFLNQYLMIVIPNPSKAIEANKIVDLVHNTTDVLFKPGTKFLYSSTNTILLAMIVERATGEKFDDLVYRDFILRYSLKNTYFPKEKEMPNTNFLHGYFEGLEISEELHPSHTWSAGGLISDVNDTRKLVEKIVKGDMLSKELHEERFKGFIDIFGDVYGMGLSNILDELWGHQGAMPGYRTLACTNKDNTQTYVIFCNYYEMNYSPKTMMKKIREIVKKYS